MGCKNDLTFKMISHTFTFAFLFRLKGIHSSVIANFQFISKSFILPVTDCISEF